MGKRVADKKGSEKSTSDILASLAQGVPVVAIIGTFFAVLDILIFSRWDPRLFYFLLRNMALGDFAAFASIRFVILVSFVICGGAISFFLGGVFEAKVSLIDRFKYLIIVIFGYIAYLYIYPYSTMHAFPFWVFALMPLCVFFADRTEFFLKRKGMLKKKSIKESERKARKLSIPLLLLAAVGGAIISPSIGQWLSVEAIFLNSLRDAPALHSILASSLPEEEVNDALALDLDPYVSRDETRMFSAEDGKTMFHGIVISESNNALKVIPYSEEMNQLIIISIPSEVVSFRLQMAVER